MERRGTSSDTRISCCRHVIAVAALGAHSGIHRWLTASAVGNTSCMGRDRERSAIS